MFKIIGDAAATQIYCENLIAEKKVPVDLIKFINHISLNLAL